MSDIMDIEDVKKKNELTPGKNEVLKNRVFGMPMTKMTRHQRVSFTAMVKIAYDTLSENPEQQNFEYDTQEFMKLIGLAPSMKKNHLFSKMFIDDTETERESEEYALEKTLRQLITKEIVFRFKNEEGKTYKVEATALLSYFKLTREKILFRFDEWIRSRILTTNNVYIMKIPIIASFKSGYTVTLFEQLEQRRDFKRWEVEIDILRRLFGVEDKKYTRFSNFRARILDVAQKEINKKTDYTLSYELHKVGRKVEKIIFTWRIEKNTYKQFKAFIRENFVNKDLIEIPSKDKTLHLISVNEKGRLYNKRKPDKFYNTEEAESVWKYMFNNQSQLEKFQKSENSDYEKRDWTIYYGQDILYDDDLYKHISSISPTKSKNKLKITFYDKTVVVLGIDEFLDSLTFIPTPNKD